MMVNIIAGIAGKRVITRLKMKPKVCPAVQAAIPAPKNVLNQRHNSLALSTRFLLI